MQVIDFDDEEHKEVCAQFGLAAFLGNALESTLGCILMGRGKIQGTATTPEQLEALETVLNKDTLGSLVRKVRAGVQLSEDTERIVVFALQRRNFLIHHFFRELAFDMDSNAGRRKLITELQEIQGVILAANKLADDLLQGLAKLLNITPTMLAAEVEDLRRQTESR